jgi:hypothetical protein
MATLAAALNVRALREGHFVRHERAASGRNWLYVSVDGRCSTRCRLH